MEIKFLDLKKINARFQSDFEKNFEDFIDSGHYILGQKTKEFEQKFASFCQSKHCLGVANGLDALILIFKSLIDLGKLKVGDVVAMQGNTFVASALAAIHCGLKIYILSPTQGYNLSIKDIESQIDSSVKSLLLVHLYGQMKDTAEIADYCKKRDIILVEDAAQAHGSEWDGKKAGQYGIAAGFSFYPGKNLGALGDGGAVVTNNDEIFEHILYLRSYGSKIKYHHEKLGYNSRLDEIQSGFLTAKLALLTQDNFRRRQIVQRYNAEISNAKLVVEEDSVQSLAHVHHLYLINTPLRDQFRTHLLKSGVETLIHYPFAIFESEPVNANVVNSYKYDLQRLNRNIISIPVSPVMTDAEVDHVISAVNAFYDQ